jgi:hypothetical protein
MNRATGSYAKVTVSLSMREVALLDSLALDIRVRSRIALSRSEVIHAIIEAAEQRNVRGDEAADLVRDLAPPAR